jgi:hypothetical protein
MRAVTVSSCSVKSRSCPRKQAREQPATRGQGDIINMEAHSSPNTSHLIEFSGQCLKDDRLLEGNCWRARHNSLGGFALILVAMFICRSSGLAHLRQRQDDERIKTVTSMLLVTPRIASNQSLNLPLATSAVLDSQVRFQFCSGPIA